MPKMSKSLRVFFLLIFIALVTGTGCAAHKKNPFQQKRDSSHVSTSQLGRNRYYFSTDYQKRLTKGYKK
jgi:hypothetical protein